MTGTGLGKLPGYRMTINPKVVHRKWSKGVADAVLEPLLPGFVLMRFDKPMGRRLVIVDEFIVHWILTYDGVLGVSKGMDMGGRVRFVEGSLADVGDLVRKVDRHRRRTVMEFSLCG
jgi:hypothetical protein